jgi:hypothetical protein
MFCGGEKYSTHKAQVSKEMKHLGDGYSLMSLDFSRSCPFWAFPVFHVSDDGVRFGALFSEVGVTPERNGMVPAIVVKQVSKENIHSPDELTRVFEPHRALLLHGRAGLPH